MCVLATQVQARNQQQAARERQNKFLLVGTHGQNLVAPRRAMQDAVRLLNGLTKSAIRLSRHSEDFQRQDRWKTESIDHTDRQPHGRRSASLYYAVAG